jgi:hypothetical protein
MCRTGASPDKIFMVGRDSVEPWLRTPKAVQDISPGSSAKRDHPGYALPNTSPWMPATAGHASTVSGASAFDIGTNLAFPP